MKRGVDIEVKVATKRPSLKFDLLKELEKELKNISSVGDFDGSTPCSECELLLRGEKSKPKELKVKPAYPCDHWDSKSRTCWLDRNIGDTVTFVLAFGEGYNPTVQWRQEFHTLHTKRRKFYIINPENPLWNIVIGSSGHELRLSPITEIDIDDNSFSAHVIDEKAPLAPSLQRVNFRIRVMPIDQGFVYPGETLTMNMRRVNLPPTSMSFKWYLESDGESGTLPSNMRLSPSGGVLTISELRKEQEGILACSVYTNLGFFATKQRFLIKEMNQSSNMLLFVPTRPAHFNEEIRRRKRREVESEDYIDQTLEDQQKKESRLESITNNDMKDNDQVDEDPKQDDSYSIENIDVYRKSHNDDSNDKNNELNEQVSAFREELKERLHSSTDNNKNHRQQVQQFRPALSPNNRKQNSITHSAGGHKGRAEHFDDPLAPNASSNEIVNNDNGNVVLEVERQPAKVKTRSQDEVSKLISRCRTYSQCSTDATCIMRDSKISHFCRCNSGYQGNGIFCWEDIKIRNSGSFQDEPERSEQMYPEPLLQNKETEVKNHP